MQSRRNQEIGIVGAGLSGSLLALYLDRYGYEVEVFETRPDIRSLDRTSQKSINLALSTRGLTALRRMGLIDEVRDLCIPMYGRKLHQIGGDIDFFSYGKDYQFINSVSRRELNQLLLERIERRDIDCHFQSKCVDIDPETPEIHLDSTESSTRPTAYSPDIVAGADGAYSTVRTEGFLKREGFDYSQEYLPHGYKELTIPPTTEGEYRLDPNALHIWPRDNFMMIALPNTDRSFTGTLFLPMEGSPSFEELCEGAPSRLERFFEREFPDLAPMIPDLEDQFFGRPTGDLVTVRCAPYHHRDRVFLLGDAAHAVVPFYGQGMNAAFEDITILSRLLEIEDHDWSEVLPSFTEIRGPDGDAIADLAIYNYTEMRSLVTRPSFRLKNRINRILGDFFPSSWMPLYSMVTFTNMPYARARRRAQRQEELLSRLLPGDALDFCYRLVEDYFESSD